MENLQKFQELIIRYNLTFRNFDPAELGWRVTNLCTSGKGTVATRCFNPGDTIFIDFPMVVGPRSFSDEIMCVGCCKQENLRSCSFGCFLPVCSSACENGVAHKFECKYLRKMINSTSNKDADLFSQLLKILTIVRCLKFADIEKEILEQLHKLDGMRTCSEVELLKKICGNISSEEEHYMRKCCRALDANAYEVRRGDISLRGLYPMASAMNHCCVPNTFHSVGEELQMVIKASTVIAPGSEITTSYSPLFLGTPARRIFLMKSKQFECTCQRCKDPTELGTYLSALRCRKNSCGGPLLPANPLNFGTVWCCEKCNERLTADKIAILQKVVAQQISRLNLQQPADIIKFIEDNKVAAVTNHAMVQFKYFLLKVLGYAEGYTYPELFDHHLYLKKKICLEILEILQKLSLERCEIKDVCLEELSATNKEIARRK